MHVKIMTYDLNTTFSGKFLINIFHFPKRQIGPNLKNSTNRTNILHHKDDLPTTFQ